jgi:PAS domain S-box-containing protein
MRVCYGFFWLDFMIDFFKRLAYGLSFFAVFLSWTIQAAEPESSELTQLKLQLLWKHQFEFAGFYAAIEKGFYREQGLDVIPEEYNPGISVVDRVLSGEVDYGVSDASLIIERSRGKPVILLANIFQHSPTILISLRDSGIISPSHLVGKRVMLSPHEESNASILAMLDSESVSLDRIEILPHTFNVDYLIDGTVDVMSAYASNEPGILKEKKIPFNVIDPINYGIDFYGNNIFTSAKKLQNDPVQVQKFVLATLKGWEYALKHPDEIIDLILEKYSTEKSRSALAYEANILRRYIVADFIPLGDVDNDRINRILDIYKQLGVVDKNYQLNNFSYQAYEQNTSISLNSQEKEWIRTHPFVYLGVDPAWPPFEFFDEKGRYQGIVADYIELISKKTGINFIAKHYANWQEVLNASKSGDVDLLPAIMASSDRREYLDFSASYLEYPMVIVTEKDSEFVGSLDVLKGRQVAVINGYVTEDLIRAYYPGVILKTFDTLSEALTALANKEIDALVDNLASISYSITKLGLSNLKVNASTPYNFELAFATQKGNDILMSIINKSLISITQREQRDIQDHWIKLNKTSLFDFKKLLVILAVIAASVLLIILWNWRLTVEINTRKRLEKKLTQSRNDLQYRNQVMELMIKGRPVNQVLIHLIEYLESGQSGISVGFFLYNTKKQQFEQVISKRLPDELVMASVDMDLKSKQSAVAAAALSGQRQICQSIVDCAFDPHFSDLNRKYQLNSCWAEPIFSTIGQVLGVFAVYQSHEAQPTGEDLEWIRDISLLVTLILEKDRHNQMLNQLSMAVEQSGSAIFITDNKGIIEYINSKFTEMTGYTSRDVVGKKTSILKSGRNDPQIYADLWGQLLSGDKWQGILYNRKKNGDYYWAAETISPVFNDEHEIHYFVAVKEDVTHKREAEEALRISETRFRNLVESTNVIAWEQDPQTLSFTYVSPHAERLLGFPVEKWYQEQFWANHIYAVDKDQVIVTRQKVLETLKDYSTEYRIIKSDGSYLWMRDMVTVEQKKTDGRVLLRGFLIDINENKLIEEALENARLEAEHASRVKSEFLATMSHELRTPMNGVLGMAQLLEETELSEEQRECVDVIMRSGNSLLDVINTVLDLSKLEAEQFVLDNRDFDLRQMCQDVIEMFKPDSRKQHNLLKINYSDALPNCYVGDEIRLKRILVNLVGNAMKFTENGMIELYVQGSRISDTHASLKVQVIDTGIGIAKDKIKQLFQPFVQADQSTTRKFGGTGLGLAITKKLIHLMNGKIGVDSEPNQGSTFWLELELPISEYELVADIPRVPVAEKVMFNGNILLVEDDKINQSVIQSYLEKIGNTVEIAENGQIAVEKCQQRSFDLVFMDCRMPILDGYSATQIIRQQPQNEHLPIIALTANSSLEEQKQCFEVGMDEVVVKPFKKEQILATLHNWLQPIQEVNDMKPEQEAYFIEEIVIDQLPESKFEQIDVKTLENFRKDMGGDFDEIYQAIIAGFDDFFSLYNSVDDISDFETLARNAHNLKSRSRHLGANKVSDLAALIEKNADKKDKAQVQTCLKQLKIAYRAACNELNRVV